MTTTRTHILTAEDLDRCVTDERWLGWGYLGERSRAAEAGESTTEADAVALRYANELGWDAEDLFHWANSKDGRWFGDWVWGSWVLSGFDDTTDDVPAWLPSVFPKVPAR